MKRLAQSHTITFSELSHEPASGPEPLAGSPRLTCFLPPQEMILALALWSRPLYSCMSGISSLAVCVHMCVYVCLSHYVYVSLSFSLCLSYFLLVSLWLCLKLTPFSQVSDRLSPSLSGWVLPSPPQPQAH